RRGRRLADLVALPSNDDIHRRSDLVALVEMAEAAECEEERDLFADANDDVGIAGLEVADGEVHPPHHAQLQQPDEMVQHEEEQQNVLYWHNEKLTVAFALLSSEPNTMIRIVKNLRMCLDCHNTIKLISRMLIPAQKVGAIIGHKGERVRRLCEETRACVRIIGGHLCEAEQAVIIFGREQLDEPLPPAMDALLRVYQQTINNDSLDVGPDNVIVRQILAPSEQAASLIGEHGVMINSIMEASQTVIRVLGNELPSDLIDTLLKWIPSNDEELRLRLSSRSTATPHASVAAFASAPVSHTAPWLGKFIAFEPFNVGGFDWAIYFYPDGKSGEDVIDSYLKRKDGLCPLTPELKECNSLYEGYVPMKYKHYCKKMKKYGEWGDHVTLQAAADK
ncbi:hypothetical protein ACJX0J_011845, partial [Zea mays]